MALRRATTKVQFIGPRTCGLEPVKSTITSSPRTTTLTRTSNGLGRRRRRPRPSCSAAYSPVGQLGDLGPQPPLGVVDQRARALADRGRRRSARPARSKRRSPTLQRADHGVEVAPGVARRPVVRQDHPPELLVVAAALDAASPAAGAGPPGRRRSRRRRSCPGALPPTSARCPIAPAKPISSPSRKIGFIIMCSGMWQLPR